MHYFWRASQLGVPQAQWVSTEDIDFLCELLGTVAVTVGNDHTLHCRTGAFWSQLGSPVDLVLPVYILTAALRKAFSRTRPELHRKMNDAIVAVARRYTKVAKVGQVPEIPGFRRNVLVLTDPGGHLPLESFIKNAMDTMADYRKEEGERLQDVYNTWDEKGLSDFDAFEAMIRHVSPEHSERAILTIYNRALDPFTHNVSMVRVESDVRRAGLALKSKFEPVETAAAAETQPDDAIRAARRAPADIGALARMRWRKTVQTVKTYNTVRTLFQTHLDEMRAFLGIRGQQAEEADVAEAEEEAEQELALSDVEDLGNDTAGQAGVSTATAALLQKMPAKARATVKNLIANSVLRAPPEGLIYAEPYPSGLITAPHVYSRPTTPPPISPTPHEGTASSSFRQPHPDAPAPSPRPSPRQAMMKRQKTQVIMPAP